MKTIRLTADIPPNRQVVVALPEDVPEGRAELVITIGAAREPRIRTLGELLESEYCGMWADRDDITDSVEFAHRLREQAWRREP